MATQPRVPGALPRLPSAVGITHLKVYDWLASDGLRGGSPHLHFACTEAYYIVAGHGRLQTLCAQGFDEMPLEPGRLVWFSPGLIHRLVDDDGDLEILVVMQNSGLPEAGDAVLTFPTEYLLDEKKYLSVASLTADGHVFAPSEEGAHKRRDLAIEGFHQLRQAIDKEGSAALERFYQRVSTLIRGKVPAWRQVWRTGPLPAADDTGRRLDTLEAGGIEDLMAGHIAALPAPGADRRLGMCGTLGLYLPEGAPK